MARIYCPIPLSGVLSLELPASAARHVQVLRKQPGDSLTLFNGLGGEYEATVSRMGRVEVAVTVGAHRDIEREASRPVHLALGMPANERMDWLVEKATELGVASITPLLVERSVLRLSGERAEKKQAHWQAIAVAASEQCGRNRVPVIHAVQSLGDWLAALAHDEAAPRERRVLSLRADARLVVAHGQESTSVLCLSGPEGGLSAAEEDRAVAAGFVPTLLGPRVLRAETAPLVALMALA